MLRADRSLRNAWGAGVGSFILASVIYLIVSGFGGGVDFEDRLTFDQSGELELEGLAILGGLVLAALIGIPLGTWIGLRVIRADSGALTALMTIVPTAGVGLLSIQLAPGSPDGPVVAPFLVFGSWFLVPFAVRYLIDKRRRRR